MTSWNSYIFEDIPFDQKAFKVFEFQYENNRVYQKFCQSLNVGPEDISRLSDIPLYPVNGFKEVPVLTGAKPEDAELTFQSSGTRGMERAHHYIADATLYRDSILQGIRSYYPLDEMIVWGYTPGYNENEQSSLIWMIQTLIDQDTSGLSRFLPVGEQIDPSLIKEAEEAGKKVLLFGAAFGLLDYIQEHEPVSLPKGSIVMETGGMKTHKREMTRNKMHRTLAKGFGVDRLQVHSEYGMTEMLSQAYARGGTWFTPSPWLRIQAKNPEDPRETLKHDKEGLIGVIDLANIYSCSFLLTGDKGLTRDDDKFKVLGRWNPENLRGCNFLVDDE